MNVVVTGAKGFIGSAVCSSLHEFGHEPIVLNMNQAGKPWRLGDVALSSLFRGAESLVHLAWDFDPASARVCAQGSIQLIQRARALGVQRVIFASSQSAASGDATSYGAAKKEVEGALDPTRDLAIRPGIVWSESPRGAYRNLVRAQLFDLTVSVSTPPVLHPVHVDDLGMIIAASAVSPAPVGILEVGEVQPRTAVELAEESLGTRPDIVIPSNGLHVGGTVARVFGHKGRYLADRLDGLVALRPMHDPLESILGISIRPHKQLLSTGLQLAR
jgi:nucleoside-diphosphate-sugar epimerase